MAEVDELFDAAVTMLYETIEEPLPSGKTPAERVHFYFGPCVSQQREQAPSFSCAEYCRQVRRKRWPYPEPHAPNVADKRPSVSSPPSQTQTAEMQRSPRHNSPQSPARQPIINPTVAEDAWVHQRRAPSPRRDVVGASEILGSTGVSPIRHITSVDDASVDQHRHDVYDQQHSYQHPLHTQRAYDPYADPRDGIRGDLSASRAVQRALVSTVTPANDAEGYTAATATTTVTNEHYYADHIEVQHNLSTSLTRRPLVSPERTDDEPQPEDRHSHVVRSHHGEHHGPHHQGAAQADSYHHHQQLDITEELQEPAKETVQQQPTGVASPPTSPLKTTVPYYDAAAQQRRAERRVTLESVQTDTTAPPNPYDNNRNDAVVSAPAPFVDTVTAPPPSADNDHNNSSTLVITAADKAAARKTRLAANRARRRKLLVDASDDILGEGEVPPAAASSVTTSPVEDVTPPPIEVAAPPPPQVVDTPSPITPQSPQLHREKGVNPVVAVNHVAPLALPEIIPRDPSLLKGRVKNFTLTYHHPPGHLFCRMWSALSGSLGKEVARLSAAALGGDFLALLQPDKDETAYTVDSVTASVHADALSIDLSIATNEKRATVAQRLQDAAGLGSAPYDISDKNALTTLPADHFPRCCRILSGYTIEGSPLPVDPTATTTHCTVDLLGAVMTAPPDALPHAVIEQCGGVLEWFHYHHGRESEIVELLPSDHVTPTQQSDQQAAPVNVVESVHSPPRVERDALFNPATETTPHHSHPSPAHEEKEESLQVSPKSPEDLRPSPESTAVFNHNNDEGNDLSLQLANIPDTPPPTATNEVGGGATFLASVVDAPIDEDRLHQDDVSTVSLEFEEDVGSKATPQPDPPSELPPPEDFTTNDNVPQVVVEDLQLADRSGGSNNITLSSVSLIPADIPWALPNPATEEDSHSTTAEHAAYPLPDVVVKWTTAGGGLSLRTPQNGSHAGIIGSVLRTLHGGGHRIQRCMSPSGDEDASNEIVPTHHQQHNTSRPTTPSPPPPDSPASPHGIVDASPGNIWGLSNIPSPSNEGPVGTHHRNSKASNQAHDDGDDSEVDPLALGPLSQLVQHRVAQDPALAFLKKHAGEVPSSASSASRFTTPMVRRPSHIASNVSNNDDDGTASRTNSPPRRPPITAEQGVFRTDWQNAAEAILDRCPANLVVDPAVTADMLARRLKNIDRICADSVKNGAVGLSYSARHKLRVCQGTMMLDKSALDRFNTGARVSSDAIVQAVADGTPSPAPRDRSNDRPSTPSSALKVKPVRITLSVEWDGLLVLKRDDGAMAGKTVLLVYPLAYGVGSNSAGAGAAEGLGKELVVELRKPTPTEAEQQAQQHEVSNQALWGKVGNVSPSAPAANLAGASDHSLQLRIDLGSHKKVEKALELLRSRQQSALKMVLQPPQQQQQTS
ncbi:Hypothetical protein, putative [Bodo saltans]|uniref:Uncharacterized protein n=1 Tax=Bodo saltans TaxID=75058 RepID=A0A0S4JR19_BODSA|nr:Hypothetical protein, putative [Bodo saltans]|eukprot:CUG90968.1 Hypothetical protein, putative [Bodo saltans]